MRYYDVSFKQNLVWMYTEKTSDPRENDKLENDEGVLKTALESLREEIEGIKGVGKVEITDNGHVVGIEAAEEDYPDIMDEVVNLFRKFDDTSIVSYDFLLNS